MDFKSEFQSVLDWNAIANENLVLKDPATVALQWSLVQEEINEVLSAESYEEFLKELADLFVVSYYMCYIVDANYDLSYETGGQKVDVSMAKDIVASLPADVYSGPRACEMIFATTCDLIAMLGSEAKQALDKTLWSNMTKFPRMSLLIEEDIDPGRECQRIENASAGRYKNVCWNNVFVNGEEYVVFKASSGKVVKPITFQEA